MLKASRRFIVLIQSNLHMTNREVPRKLFVMYEIHYDDVFSLHYEKSGHEC